MVNDAHFTYLKNLKVDMAKILTLFRAGDFFAYSVRGGSNPTHLVSEPAKWPVFGLQWRFSKNKRYKHILSPLDRFW